MTGTVGDADGWLSGPGLPVELSADLVRDHLVGSTLFIEAVHPGYFIVGKRSRNWILQVATLATFFPASKYVHSILPWEEQLQGVLQWTG